MKLYELTVILNSSLEESVIQAEIGKIENQITSAEGKIQKLERWGARRLTYLIRGSNQGYYVHFLFEAPTNLIAEMDKVMRINENVLRYLTVLAPVLPKPEEKGIEVSPEEPSSIED